MKKLLESINVAEKAVVDVSNNKLSFNADTITSFDHIKHIAELDMQVNNKTMKPRCQVASIVF